MICIKELKNFGVIKEIKDAIEINDLTIFMGDNSSGKSYVSMLIHSIINLKLDYYIEDDFFRYIKDEFGDSKVLKQLEITLDNILDDTISSNTTNKIVNIILDETHQKDMVEIIKISLNRYLVPKYLAYKLFNRDILEYINIDLSKIDKYLFKEISISTSENSINVNFNTTHFNITFPPSIPKNIIKNIIKKSVFNDIIKTLITTPLNSFFDISKSTYLPASRTGYMQTYSILAENAISKTYMRDINTQKNTLNIILQEFITKLNMTSDIKDTHLNKFIEENMINGKVSLSSSDNSISYKTNDGIDIEIDLLSSTVSELMPLVIFLKKGFITSNSLLIIEEPEAHLSFKNQKFMAQLIALFLKHNIKVLITTHSDFLITEINNLIIKNSLNERNKDTKYELSINHKQVNVYNFLLNQNNKSIVERVKVDKEGIESDYIFDNIYKTIEEKNSLLKELDNLNGN